MKYVIKDKIKQVNSPHTNKKYLSNVSGWYHHLRRSTCEKTVNVICRLTDINHSSVEGEALSIIFKREEVDIQ
jgi:hypothetical protein